MYSDPDKERKIWRKLSNLILGSKNDLKKFLCSVNQDLYIELQEEAQKEMEKLSSTPKIGQKKRRESCRLFITKFLYFISQYNSE